MNEITTKYLQEGKFIGIYVDGKLRQTCPMCRHISGRHNGQAYSQVAMTSPNERNTFQTINRKFGEKKAMPDKLMDHIRKRLAGGWKLTELKYER